MPPLKPSAANPVFTYKRPLSLSEKTPPVSNEIKPLSLLCLLDVVEKSIFPL